MGEAKPQSVYFVVFMTPDYPSIAQAQADAPELIAAHIARSRELHRSGTLVMGGAFLDHPEESLTTMGVLTSREAAEDFVKGDPFVRAGKVRTWTIREWANILA